MPVLLVLLLLAALFLPGFWVKRVLKQYRQPEDRYQGTGAEFARHLLDRLRMESVIVERTEQGDHYDPDDRAVRLSPPHYDGRSLAAVTVAAHEVGHAIQHQDGYTPLKLRSHLARLSGPLSKFGVVLLTLTPFLGLLTRSPAGVALGALGGVAALGSATLLHLVTLPVEWDASFGRALPLLKKGEFLHQDDYPHARRILTAAALTYVAASLFSLLNLWRWLRVLR